MTVFCVVTIYPYYVLAETWEQAAELVAARRNSFGPDEYAIEPDKYFKVTIDQKRAPYLPCLPDAYHRTTVGELLRESSKARVLGTAW